MSVAVIVTVPGGTEAQYRAMMDEIFGTFTPPVESWDEGGQLHMAGEDGKGNLIVIDVWNSPAEFIKFMEAEIIPAAKKVDLPEPQIQFIPLINLIY